MTETYRQAAERVRLTQLADEVFDILRAASHDTSELQVQVRRRGEELQITMTLPIGGHRYLHRSVYILQHVLESAKGGVLSGMIVEAYRELRLERSEAQLKRMACGQWGPLERNRLVSNAEEAREAFGAGPLVLPSVKKEDIVEQPGIDEAVRRAAEHYDDMARRAFEACGLPREVVLPGRDGAPVMTVSSKNLGVTASEPVDLRSPPPWRNTLEAGPGIAARTDLVTPPRPVHWRCPWDPEDLG